MARVKRAVHSKKHRRATLERAKGYYGNKSRSYRAANEQVGMRRAQRMAELLRARGLEAMELRVESHGERNLLVATPDATAEPRNRRVEVLVR